MQIENHVRKPVAEGSPSDRSAGTSKKQVTTLDRGWQSTWLAFSILAVLATLAFGSLLRSPGGTLYSDHSDLLAMHLPMKHFLVESFHQHGEVPNWCPYSFAGMPFVHDVQLAAYYPFHLLLYLLPIALIGAALSWIVWFHVMVAGWGMFLYGRRTGLSWLGATAAASGWMFAGKWMLHLFEGGHYIVSPLAWMPWVLWCLHAAVEKRTSRDVMKWSIGAGLIFGMMVLGTHPQILFYCGLGIAVTTLTHAFLVSESFATSHSERSKRVARAVAGGMLCAAVAIGCGAAQLLPALEATPMTSRVEGVPPSDTLPGGMRVLMNFFGPAIVAIKSSGRWEDRGGFAVITVLLAAIAVCSNGSDLRVRRQFWIFTILILYAFGAAILFQSLPGFRLFRQATRMVLVAALPLAWLAGAGVDAFLSGRVELPVLRRNSARLFIAAGLLCGGVAIRGWIEGNALIWHSYWLSLVVTVPASCLLIARAHTWRPRRQAYAWTAVLVFDAMMVGVPSIEVKPSGEIYPTNTAVSALVNQCQVGDRILDRDAGQDDYASPLGTGMPLALIKQLEPVRGYNSFDIANYRRYLKRIAGDESELRPFEDAWTYPLIGDFPIQNQPLLDLLGVRYLIAPQSTRWDEPWNAMSIIEDQPKGYSVIEGGVRSMPAYRVWENEGVFPKCMTIPQHLIEPNGSDNLSLANVLSQGVDCVDPVKIDRYEPNCIQLSIQIEEPRLLVVTDAWFPGWECYVDGKRNEIQLVEGLFRGVRLNEDAKQVQFVFRPHSVWLGRWVTTFVLCGSSMMLLLLQFSRGLRLEAKA